MTFRDAFSRLLSGAAPSLGSKGERLAEAFLRGRGYRILAANYKNPAGRALGEIDIVAREGDEIVFVEVKTRTFRGETDRLPPESAISPEKLRRLSKIADHYLAVHDLVSAPFRFDAIAVSFQEGREEPVIRHLKHIYL